MGTETSLAVLEEGVMSLINTANQQIMAISIAGGVIFGAIVALAVIQELRKW
jgi:hypothetical protein